MTINPESGTIVEVGSDNKEKEWNGIKVDLKGKLVLPVSNSSIRNIIIKVNK